MLLAFVASYHAGDLFLAMVAVAIVLPAVLLAQRVRHARTEDLEPGLLRRLPYAAQAANVWLFAALLGVASLPGTFALYELMLPDSHRTIELAFWIGLAAIALLALVPRRRISLAFNFLVALGSLFLTRPARADRARPGGRRRDRPAVRGRVVRRARAAGARS